MRHFLPRPLSCGAQLCVLWHLQNQTPAFQMLVPSIRQSCPSHRMETGIELGAKFSGIIGRKKFGGGWDIILSILPSSGGRKLNNRILCFNVIYWKKPQLPKGSLSRLFPMTSNISFWFEESQVYTMQNSCIIITLPFPPGSIIETGGSEGTPEWTLSLRPHDFKSNSLAAMTCLNLHISVPSSLKLDIVTLI